MGLNGINFNFQEPKQDSLSDNKENGLTNQTSKNGYSDFIENLRNDLSTSLNNEENEFTVNTSISETSKETQNSTNSSSDAIKNLSNTPPNNQKSPYLTQVR